MKVVVVGAGPSGCHAAFLFAQAGAHVTVLEEHENVGLPVACTGIVTHALYRFVPRDSYYIVNELSSANILSHNSSLVLPLKEDVICRKRFDSWMADRARKAGARLLTCHSFKQIRGNKAVCANGKEFMFDVLVGADGPLSPVAKAAGIYGKREFWIGQQVTLKGDFHSSQFKAFFGSVCPGFFAWSVPESSSVARVGLASSQNARKFFERFLERCSGEVVDKQAGPIPKYQRRRFAKGNVYLIGDAAGLVKSTTGGGVITGLWSAELLAHSVLKGKPYSLALLPLRRELWLHNQLRKMLDRFSEADYDSLLRMMRSPKVQSLLESYPREYPSRLLFRLLMAKPGFLRFVWKYF